MIKKKKTSLIRRIYNKSVQLLFDIAILALVGFVAIWAIKLFIGLFI